jgi:DNA-directed RNA polymerase specialized sigma24 family protein
MSDDTRVERQGDQANQDLRPLPARLVDVLLGLGELLGENDRALLEAIYRRGLSAADLARAIRTRPRTIQNRLRRLTCRVNSPIFRLVAGRCDALPPLRREVGERIVLRGESQRTVAAQLGVSLHRVRQELTGLRALGAMARRDGQPS